MARLPGPPRSRTLTEISPVLAKSPELAGLRAGAWSMRAAKWIPTAISVPLSLASKFRFPATESAPSGDWSNAALLLGKAENLVLLEPFGAIEGLLGKHLIGPNTPGH